MIIYNTTFHIEKESVQECLEYLKKTFVPEAMDSGFLQQPCLMRVLHTTEDEGESYSLQFFVKNVDTLNFWLQREGGAMHNALVRRFGSKVVGFTTLLEKVDLEG